MRRRRRDKAQAKMKAWNKYMLDTIAEKFPRKPTRLTSKEIRTLLQEGLIEESDIPRLIALMGPSENN
jgi:hypothetical protein